MKINEIQADEYITLSFHLKGKYFEFRLKVISSLDNCILTEPIRLNGIAVDLSAAGIGVDITYTKQGSIPVIWRLVRCKRCTIDGKVLYKFVPTSDGVKCNRRSDFRLEISLNGIVQMGENTGTKDVIVRDVSSNGFSFTYSKEIEDCIGIVVRAVFFDPKYGGTFTMSGTIVRSAKMREDVILYGCRMKKEDQKLSKYIAAKQMERFYTTSKKK